MASLVLFSEELDPHLKYYDKKSGLTREQMAKLEEKSKTVYVGNLSFSTKEENLFSVFSQCGPVKRIIMGVNRNTHEPCGFCFVEFYDREAAVAATRSDFKINGRKIKVDIDRGFEEGRQYGRGRDGNQIRDNRKEEFDPDRPVKINRYRPRRNY